MQKIIIIITQILLKEVQANVKLKGKEIFYLG
jgi:hypothetical protein